ncbi:MAG TPA: AAA family ATPase [Candidatus Dormibacteraeota bacterium]|jgi:wobble nucleotide-excising tRNase|nr:AAA family ATPase [Candidatus Dormibacteraeota bacterium]
MINRIQLLRNIGQFDSVNNATNIPLARLTVVYSENGRGKTTLAAVLRSLATGNPLPISERRRLAADNPPHAVLDCTGGPPPAVFQNNAWNRTLPDLVVFDDNFIDQNVHSGLAVEARHRQSLHELILGAQAVGLSQQLQALVAQIEAHNTELRIRAGAIPAADRGPFSVDEFCALPARPDIDEAIRAAERNLAAAREQDAIRNTPPLDLLNLPAFDLAAIEQVLQQDLPALEAATLAQVQTHLAGLGQGGEEWVADGIRRIPHGGGGAATRTCPFCAQDLQGSPVIQHYRTYFSQAYASLKSTVSDTLGAVNRSQGGDVPAGFERAVRVAGERRQFWSRFCEVAEFTLDTAAIVRHWRVAREAVMAHLAAKQATPLERMGLSEGTRGLLATYEADRATIATLNQRLREANQEIAVAKERAATANSTVLAADLARLNAVRTRHTPAITALCEEYLRERAAKEATERRRDEARAALERHRTTVFPGYQTTINIYLQRFNAGFRLDSVTSANTRGGPTCTYNVIINNTPVPIGGGDPELGEPSFRNTLSAGDRNTLALAFFFASLDQDADLANKVIVIDDPISSLDDHRALTTVQEIRHLAGRASQVIVLSHNKPFLCRLWEGTDSTMRAALEVARDPAGSTIRAWDVGQDSITEHDRRHARLRDHLTSGTGDMREVARSIRPHLEAFLRVACPEQFLPGTLLGVFRNACRQRLGTPQQILDNRTTPELDELVEYANRFHHDTNPAWETEAINDGELTGFVRRALNFARR